LQPSHLLLQRNLRMTKEKTERLKLLLDRLTYDSRDYKPTEQKGNELSLQVPILNKSDLVLLGEAVVKHVTNCSIGVTLVTSGIPALNKCPVTFARWLHPLIENSNFIEDYYNNTDMSLKAILGVNTVAMVHFVGQNDAIITHDTEYAFDFCKEEKG